MKIPCLIYQSYHGRLMVTVPGARLESTWLDRRHTDDAKALKWAHRMIRRGQEDIVAQGSETVR